MFSNLNYPLKLSPAYFAGLLWLLLGLFCLRVGGQILVAFFAVTFLPPMEAWFSGLLPYPQLLMAQILIILVYCKVSLDFSRRSGFFFRPQSGLGKPLFILSSIYFVSMMIRYIIRMSLYPDERWFGGTIPIVYHWVLASFILLVGGYHWLQIQQIREQKL